MKLIGTVSDRLLGYLLPSAKADAGPLPCYCDTDRWCGSGGERSLLCCLVNGSYQCTCRC